MSRKRSSRSHTPTNEPPSFLKNIEERVPSGTLTTGLNEAPDVSLEIDHIYGFSNDHNQGVYFGKDNNEIVFMAGAVGVVQDLSTRQ